MGTTNDKDKVREAFATRFRTALTDMGIRHTEQARLRKLFGISGQAVRKWAEGTAMPTQARMPEVARVLCVRRAWLQDGEGPMRPLHAVAEEPGLWDERLTLSPEEARFLARYRLLNEEQRRALEVVLRAMVGDDD